MNFRTYAYGVGNIDMMVIMPRLEFVGSNASPARPKSGMLFSSLLTGFFTGATLIDVATLYISLTPPLVRDQQARC